MNQIVGVSINPYLLSIVGGIVAFVIVWVASRFVLTISHRSHRARLVDKANEELIAAIVPLIIERRLPRSSIIESFRDSIAQKYGIEQGDIISNLDLSQRVINHIMTNPYLRTDQKVDLCDTADRIANQRDLENKCSCRIINSPILSSMSLILGILSGTQVLLTTLFVSCKDPGFASDFRNFILLFSISVLLPILLLLLAHIPGSLLKQVKAKKQKDKALPFQKTIDEKDDRMKENLRAVKAKTEPVAKEEEVPTSKHVKHDEGKGIAKEMEEIPEEIENVETETFHEKDSSEEEAKEVGKDETSDSETKV